MQHSLKIAAGIALLAASARAELFQVTANGTVGFNVIAGAMAPVPDGAPVSMTLQVDSNNFVNGPTFPTRGYVMDPASFQMSVGGVPVPFINPQPGGATTYFVLRNNDPAVDGFFLSNNNVEFPFMPAVNIPGLAPEHELSFEVSYANGTQISSLNIADAVGVYGTANLGSFSWTIGRFGGIGAEYNFDTLTIALVPEPGAMVAVPALLGLMAARRRR